jgi:hypothetical protein
MFVDLNSLGYTAAFLNPVDSTGPTVVHNTPGTDYSDLYEVEDWVGSTVSYDILGGLVQQKVLNNANTQGLNLRPNLTFKAEADWMDFYYCQYGTVNGGAAFETWGNSWIRCYSDPTGVLGSGAMIDPGQTITKDSTGEIYAPAVVAVLDIEAAVDWSWVFQNTPSTTQDRHVCIITVTIVSEASAGESYDVTFTEDGGAVTNFQTIVAGVDPNTWKLIGGRVGSSTANSPATYAIAVTYTGQDSEQSDTATVAVALRKLGDVDGNGLVNAVDKLNFNKRLNGIGTAFPDRCYDLSGDGLVNAVDKLAMNRALNLQNIP